MDRTPESLDNDEEPRDAGLSALYARTPREQPDDDLDQTVLAAARREAGSRPKALESQPSISHPPSPTRVPWHQRWRIPLSIAATLVLSVSVVSTVLREHQDPLSESRSAAPGEAPRTEPLPAAPTPAPAPAPPAPASQAPSRPTPAAPRTTAPKPAAIAPATPMPPPPVPAAPAASESAQQKREAGSASDSIKTERSQPPAATADQRSMARQPSRALERERNAVAPSSGAPAIEIDPDRPQAWLDAIEAMRQRGDLDGARRSLDRFRERYPQWEVPAALAPLTR